MDYCTPATKQLESITFEKYTDNYNKNIGT